MKKKKKKLIVTVLLAWVFILGSSLDILSSARPQIYLGFKSAGVFCFSVYILGFAKNLFSIICGIFILRLRSWGRRLAIILCLFNMVLAPLSLNIASGLFSKQDRLSKIEQLIQKEQKPEDQKQILEMLKQDDLEYQRQLRIYLIILIVITFAWNLFNIYYFWRPKVKQQFEL